jgi:MarR family transcriptional regulator, transcriptional regulator for hemolysin
MCALMFTLDPELNVGFLLHDVSRLMRASFDQRAQALGLTRAQWRVLVHLAPRQGINQSALADILELDAVTMGRHVDRLERDGWLERRADPGDRRAWRLYLTEASQPTLDRMDRIATEMQAAALQGVSSAERERLTDMLSRIKANLAPAATGDTAPARPRAAG